MHISFARLHYWNDQYLHVCTYCSIALLGHQPFLSLVLTCMKGQEDQRDALLRSLHDQLEKFVNNSKEPQVRAVALSPTFL